MRKFNVTFCACYNRLNKSFIRLLKMFIETAVVRLHRCFYLGECQPEKERRRDLESWKTRLQISKEYFFYVYVLWRSDARAQVGARKLALVVSLAKPKPFGPTVEVLPKTTQPYSGFIFGIYSKVTQYISQLLRHLNTSNRLRAKHSGLVTIWKENSKKWLHNKNRGWL